MLWVHYIAMLRELRIKIKLSLNLLTESGWRWTRLRHILGVLLLQVSPHLWSLVLNADNGWKKITYPTCLFPQPIWLWPFWFGEKLLDLGHDPLWWSGRGVAARLCLVGPSLGHLWLWSYSCCLWKGWKWIEPFHFFSGWNVKLIWRWSSKCIISGIHYEFMIK